ncbi:hypothetical protein PMIN01_04427 [Paraphaeosphaeria minitans]|uniref:Uncharacterized protein n=1 Tax=Paraphaeosphaeria minitans TaxID=565426 RepID=A0A9P6GKA6_9PLEO|nr:hypothetical protein PMIN01_04427 [Paraphaeosphaeria minitans]
MIHCRWAAKNEVMINEIGEIGCLNAWGPNSEAEVAVIESGCKSLTVVCAFSHQISPNEKVRNPCLFQCANEDHTCDNNDNLPNPCPARMFSG